MVKAYASDQNPLQTIVELVITPFGPNKNNQRIPRSEASNILRTCLNQPIKIDLEGNTIGGHKGAYPVGTITFAEETETAIIGRGVIWSEEFPEVCDFLKKRTAENNPPGTSWEILFEHSTIAEDGIEDLHNTVYAANCIVNSPSYGNRTLIRAIAEDLGALMEENTKTEKTEAEDLEEERKEISDLQNQLLAMWSFLDDVYLKTFEIESAEATKTESVESFTDRFNKIISKLTERADQAGVALAEKQSTIQDLETKLAEIQSELDTLKAEKAQAELNAKIAKRESALAEIEIVLDETNKDTILEMTDAQFDIFVAGIKQVRDKYSSGKAIAETRIKLPDPVIPNEITNDLVVESHKAAVKKGK